MIFGIMRLFVSSRIQVLYGCIKQYYEIDGYIHIYE